MNARDLTIRLVELLQREQAALADFLLALADFDRRRLWLELGHSSLFYFLHRELGLSKGAAYYRKTAAQLVQHYPEVIEPLRDGRLCITSIVELAKVITPENRQQVLPRFFHRSKQEAKAVAAELLPQEAPARRVVTASVANGARSRSAQVDSGPASPPADTQIVRPPVQPVEPDGAVSGPAPATSRGSRSSVEPLTADLRRLHVTVSRTFLDKLEAARSALSHSHPGADAEQILEAGLDLLLAREAKRKGIVEKPRQREQPLRQGYVPARVRRAVWARDGGRCQWPLASGGTCDSTLRVQYDHIVPKARGGPSTVENVRLLCRLHNDLAARQAFGDGWMKQFRRETTAPGS